MVADTCIVWIMPATETIGNGKPHTVYIVKEKDGNVYRSYDPKYANDPKTLFLFK